MHHRPCRKWIWPVGVMTSDATVDDGTLREQAQSWRIEGRDLLKV